MIPINKEIREAMPQIVRKANSIARAEGCGRATHFEIVEDEPSRVVAHTPYGYRKWTTGEYVPKAYIYNFGWKNTYYQHAQTFVAINRQEVENVTHG